MELKEAILKRRSVKMYSDRPVERKDIVEILNLAVYAPSHQMRQTWRFIYIDKEGLNKLSASLEDILRNVNRDEAKTEYPKKLLASSGGVLIILNGKNPADMTYTLEEYAAAFRIGAPDPAVAAHLKACAHCREIAGKLEKESDRFLDILRSAPSAPASECPDHTLLAAYLDKALDPGQRNKIEQHLALCRPCQQKMISIYRETDASGLGKPKLGTALSRWFWPSKRGSSGLPFLPLRHPVWWEILLTPNREKRDYRQISIDKESREPV
jgi:nitroreductase